MPAETKTQAVPKRAPPAPPVYRIGGASGDDTSGREPLGWQRHSQAVMAEAKALVSESQAVLVALMTAGTWDELQRSPLLGTDVLDPTTFKAVRLWKRCGHARQPGERTCPTCRRAEKRAARASR